MRSPPSPGEVDTGCVHQPAGRAACAPRTADVRIPVSSRRLGPILPSADQPILPVTKGRPFIQKNWPRSRPKDALRLVAPRISNQTASMAWIDQAGTQDNESRRAARAPRLPTAIDDGRVAAATIIEVPFLAAATVDAAKARAPRQVLRRDRQDASRPPSTSSLDDYVQSQNSGCDGALCGQAMHDSIVYTNTHLPETVDLVASYSGIEAAGARREDASARSTPEYVDPRNLQPMIDTAVKYGLIERPTPTT